MLLYMGGTWSRSLQLEKVKDIIKNPPSLKLLYSFVELKNKKEMEFPSYCTGVFLDSGAFSVANSGKTIDIDSYIEFIKKNKDNFDVMACLDVIDNPKQSKKNYDYMVKNGVNTLPCYHIGEDEKYLDYYVSQTDYIGLGGLVGRNKHDRINFLDKVFSKYPDPKKVKFHGFGVNDFELLNKFPFYSVDSAAIVLAAINRRLVTDKGVIYTSNKLFSTRGTWYNQPARDYVSELCVKYLGDDYVDLICSEDVTLSVCLLVFLMYMIVLEKEFTSDYVYERNNKSKLF